MRRIALLLLLAGRVFAGALLPAGTLQFARSNHDAALLADGRVLVAGGTIMTREIEIFDPATGRSTLGGETPLPLEAPRVTALAGRAVITGGGYRTDGRPVFGTYGDTYVGTYDTELRETATLNVARESHTATALGGGRILVAGGITWNIGGFHVWKSYLAAAEIIDAGGARLIAPLAGARSYHTATLLADGRVLIAGGEQDYGVALDTAELFDPATETFTTINMPAALVHHTATRLDDGRVLLVGRTSFFFDPATNTFSPGPDLGWRTGHTATLLRGGRVLIAGSGDAIVYDPVRNEIVERLPLDLGEHAAVRLDDGTVLLIGGVRGGRIAGVLRYVPDGTPRRRAVRK